MTQLLQNAVYGGAMILAVALLRRALKNKLVPAARLALWAVCLFRLLTPAAPTSVLSLWGLFPREGRALPSPAAPVAPGAEIAAPAVSPEAAPAGIPWWALGWLAVSALLAAGYVVRYLRTRRAVRCAAPVRRDDPRYASLPWGVRLREGEMDGAPLTFGAVRPTVVLPPELGGMELECVLAHEGVHAARRDNLWHYVMALALAVYWWNPAVWLMSRLLRRDVELACDRAAVKRLGAARRVDYANALVTLATTAEGPAFCQAFGQKATEERVRSVMKSKRLGVLGGALTLALVLAVTVGFASDPGPSEPNQPAPAGPAQDGGATTPADTGTVEYEGRTYARADLSQGTLDWLDWYLALDEETQLAVSFVPSELRPETPPETEDAKAPIVEVTAPVEPAEAPVEAAAAPAATADHAPVEKTVTTPAAGTVTAPVETAAPVESVTPPAPGDITVSTENVTVPAGNAAVSVPADPAPADCYPNNSCGVAGCTVSGAHTAHCDGSHSGGVCDGSCLYGQTGGHHGNGYGNGYGHHGDNHH